MEIKFFYVHMFSKQHINIIISTPQNKSNATLEIKIINSTVKKKTMLKIEKVIFFMNN